MNNESTSIEVTVTATTVTCHSCGCDIPLDEAVVPEALPYVVHFCGLECYARWRAAAAGAYIQSLPGA